MTTKLRKLKEATMLFCACGVGVAFVQLSLGHFGRWAYVIGALAAIVSWINLRWPWPE